MSFLEFILERPDPAEKAPEPKQAATAGPSSFEFVTFQDLGSMRNASAKSQIRKHAMKDIGAARRRPNKRRTRGYTDVPVEFVPDALAPQPACTSISYDGVDPFLQLPVTLDRQGRKLVANMFGSAQGALRDDWFTVALTAAPAFNQALANSALQYETADIIHENNRSAIQYHLLALSSVRVDLGQSQGKGTEAVIASVSAIVCWNTIRGASADWDVQLSGMLGLVNSYEGGLQALSRNKTLRSTISWVELRGAYMQDVPPRLPLPDTWIRGSNNILKDDDGTDYQELVDQLFWTHDLDFASSYNDLFGIYNLLVRCSRHVERDVIDASRQHKPPTLPLWVNVIIFRLLTVRPLDNGPVETAAPGNLVAEAFRLAMLLYMATIWRFYGSHPAHTAVHLRKLRATLESPILSTHWCPALRSLQTWVLCTGAMEASFSDQNGLESYFVNTLVKLAVTDDFISETTRDILWIPGLFDQQASMLYQSIQHVTDMEGYE